MVLSNRTEVTKDRYTFFGPAETFTRLPWADAAQEP